MLTEFDNNYVKWHFSVQKIVLQILLIYVFMNKLSFKKLATVGSRLGEKEKIWFSIIANSSLTHYRGRVFKEQAVWILGSILKLSWRFCSSLLLITLNSLPNNKILDLSKLKAFADYKINDPKIEIWFVEG